MSSRKKCTCSKCYTSSGGSKKCTIKECKEVDCSEWKVDDYRRTKGFRCGVKPSDKCYFYNSPLAVKGDIFSMAHPNDHYQPPYHVKKYYTDSRGLAISFDVNKPWSDWGGDANTKTTGVGYFNYPIFISHFGHLHIETLYGRIQADRVSPGVRQKFSDMVLKHTINNSSQIFGWFAGLLDNEGKRLPITGNSPSTQLKNLFTLLIFGESSQGHVKSIDTAIITEAFTNMARGHPMEDELLIQIEDLKKALEYMLLNTCINFMPWKHMMEIHQTIIWDNYKSQRDFSLGKHDKNKVNQTSLEVLETGRMMAAFFSAFYAAVNFLDTLLGTEVVPKSVDRRRRCLNFYDNMYRYWMEHVALFVDFNRSAALNCDEEMFQIAMAHTESCGNISSYLGQLFISFDNLIRNKKLYEIVDA